MVKLKLPTQERFIKSDYIVSAVLIIFAMLLIHYFIPYSNPDSRFSGNADSFNIVNTIGRNIIIGDLSEIYFQANTIILGNMNNPDLTFRHVKNITIENYKGEKKLINYSHYIQIKNYKNKYLTLSNGHFDFGFRNFTMAKTSEPFYNSIYINGIISQNQIFSNGGEVGINNYSIGEIIISDQSEPNFKDITFKMDKNGTVEFSTEISEVSAYPISDLKIEGKFSKLTLNRGEGTLKLGNHQFDIKPADYLAIEILPHTSQLFVNDTKIIFAGTTNHSLLNNDNIIMSDFSYWLLFQPQIISGFGVLIAVFLAALSYYFSFRQKIIQNKDEKQKFLNILSAEFETNNNLLENLKKSITDINQNKDEFGIKLKNFVFIPFREDGFNAFRDQGGFRYIEQEFYKEIQSYYISLYLINKKLGKFDWERGVEPLFERYIREEVMREIESSIKSSNKLRSRLERK